MNFEVGRVYVGRITRRFGLGDNRDDFKSVIVHAEDRGRDKNDILSVRIKRFFSENEPFTILQQLEIGTANAVVYKILINNKICHLHYFDEPQTEFELIC